MKEIITIIPLVLGVCSLILAIYARFLSQGQCSSKIIQLAPSDIGSISPDDTKLAINKIINYTKNIKPDNIVGLNRGGVLIAAYVALSLNIPTENFARCLVSQKDNRVECGNPKPDGVLLIIDDISRSGGTMQMAVDYFKENYKNLQKIYTACLVTHVNDKSEPSYKNLNFSAFTTLDNNFMLPWTPKQGQKKSKVYSSEYFNQNIKNVSIKKLAEEVESNLKKSNNVLPTVA